MDVEATLVLAMTIVQQVVVVTKRQKVTKQGQQQWQQHLQKVVIATMTKYKKNQLVVTMVGTSNREQVAIVTT